LIGEPVFEPPRIRELWINRVITSNPPAPECQLLARIIGHWPVVLGKSCVEITRRKRTALLKRKVANLPRKE